MSPPTHVSIYLLSVCPSLSGRGREREREAEREKEVSFDSYTRSDFSSNKTLKVFFSSRNAESDSPANCILLSGECEIYKWYCA